MVQEESGPQWPALQRDCWPPRREQFQWQRGAGPGFRGGPWGNGAAWWNFDLWLFVQGLVPMLSVVTSVPSSPLSSPRRFSLCESHLPRSLELPCLLCSLGPHGSLLSLLLSPSLAPQPQRVMEHLPRLSEPQDPERALQAGWVVPCEHVGWEGGGSSLGPGPDCARADTTMCHYCAPAPSWV